jgi:hypothetical protein
MTIETPPKVFISYSYDNDAHVSWVRQLATDLRDRGVDAILDEWELSPGQDLAQFMEQGVSRSNRVLLICSDAYVRKADAGAGGVGYEKMIITKELVSSIDTTKFIPLIRANSGHATPVCLGARKYVDFNEESSYQQSLEELARALLQAPRHPKPPIGRNPFVATGGASVPPRDVFADPWFDKHRTEALAKIRNYTRGAMEVSFGAKGWSATVDQRALLKAATDAEIHTFGWPIGVVLERDDGRPRPTNDGLVAEVEHSGFSDCVQFDYWAMRRNGDFYLLQNLFEDSRKPDALFFNTRMVRVAEALLHCRNLFNGLACPSSTQRRRSSTQSRMRMSSPPQKRSCLISSSCSTSFGPPMSCTERSFRALSAARQHDEVGGRELPRAPSSHPAASSFPDAAAA